MQLHAHASSVCLECRQEWGERVESAHVALQVIKLADEFVCFTVVCLTIRGPVPIDHGRDSRNVVGFRLFRVTLFILKDGIDAELHLGAACGREAG